MKNINDLKYNNKGLITVVTQDFESKQILMVAYAKKEQIIKTINTKKATYFSRSRNKEWIKGETSGHYQEVIEVKVDCDRDAVLYIVKQIGVACHTGKFTCFYRSVNEKGEYEDDRE